MVLLVAIVAAGPVPSPAQDDPAPEATQDSVAPSCQNSCRGLGIKKVQAGDVHCGLVSREIKDEALDAACGLAEAHRESLQEQAEEKAWEKCAEESDQAACRCRTELRSWQNVYTHVFSQRCWTECGWAFLVECERRPTTDDG